MLDTLLETLGLKAKPVKKRYKYKLVFRGRVISRHYKKKSALAIKKPWQTLLPIDAPIRSRSKEAFKMASSSFAFAKESSKKGIVYAKRIRRRIKRKRND